MTDRELDALVAEVLNLPPPGADDYETRYSSTGDGMLAVVEAMSKRDAVDTYMGGMPDNQTPKGGGWKLSGVYEYETYPDERREYRVTFNARDEYSHCIAQASDASLPRAVSLAALKAVGG